MSKEARKLALEAFKTLTQYNMNRANIFRRFEPNSTEDYVDLRKFREKEKPAINALEKALAKHPAPVQQEPEPVAAYTPFINSTMTEIYKYDPANKVEQATV